MSDPRRDNSLPSELRVNLDDVRTLELRYSGARPDKVCLTVEYVGGRIKVFEVDKVLIERLLEQLEERRT